MHWAKSTGAQWRRACVEYEKASIMANWPYNTARWDRLRRRVLREEPLCGYCRDMGQVKASEVVDHIVPVKQGITPARLSGLCQRP